MDPEELPIHRRISFWMHSFVLMPVEVVLTMFVHNGP